MARNDPQGQRGKPYTDRSVGAIAWFLIFELPWQWPFFFRARVPRSAEGTTSSHVSGTRRIMGAMFSPTTQYSSTPPSIHKGTKEAVVIHRVIISINIREPAFHAPRDSNY
ncbi:hypothetical protein JDV02_004754 [Purpureocillium takamizusanense]|uniref:Uncharacterized protein n=1 Tax=Purpureocillium takamizusanense TaxID=2060973 RepID=A0A9Q8QEI1_9HYPO|nr:uncharacterized protein JDV02_004754 [Purpureocillium takamizusanense]UNI18488.1 hypothetical protein JDV02_004754 [Purpureocillium takamizusanense]